jgi:hypothetical protein
MMEEILSKAIESVQGSEVAFTKFITANDTGATGGHQFGFHIHKNSWSLFFDQPGMKNNNKDRFITIRWQDDFDTLSRCIYYGTGTRNEYRLTRFGKNFPFLSDNCIGDLLIISKKSNDYYEAFVLETDDDINNFFVALNLSSTETNRIIPRLFVQSAEQRLQDYFSGYINSLTVDFPPTIEIATNARLFCNNISNITSSLIRKSPDQVILDWLGVEFQLFKTIENDRYLSRISTPFSSVEELIETANTMLNRRKSRAGKSLEHHLSEIFRTNELSFESQVITEGNKKPDFLFPNVDAYLNPHFNENKLIVLASKTTCKDRWRQILNEADRVRTKHLFTLQQGISKNQLEEMYRYDVCLVVPKNYLTSFPLEFRHKILTLDGFVNHVQSMQE